MVSPQSEKQEQQWVLLNYRLPREPSTPRIAVWRKLKALGVAQLGDGLVTLPHTPETQEQLEWVANQILESSGEAITWIARPSSRRDSKALKKQMQAERTGEYAALSEEIENTGSADRRTLARWRRQYRQIEKKDHFAADGRDGARLAIDAVATTITGAKRSVGSP